MLKNKFRYMWIQKQVYVKIKNQKRFYNFKVVFLKRVLTHTVCLLNKMINEIKKYLPLKLKSITVKI